MKQSWHTSQFLGRFRRTLETDVLPSDMANPSVRVLLSARFTRCAKTVVPIGVICGLFLSLFNQFFGKVSLVIMDRPNTPKIGAERGKVTTETRFVSADDAMFLSLSSISLWIWIFSISFLRLLLLV